MFSCDQPSHTHVTWNGARGAASRAPNLKTILQNRLAVLNTLDETVHTRCQPRQLADALLQIKDGQHRVRESLHQLPGQYIVAGGGGKQKNVRGQLRLRTTPLATRTLLTHLATWPGVHEAMSPRPRYTGHAVCAAWRSRQCYKPTHDTDTRTRRTRVKPTTEAKYLPGSGRVHVQN